MMSICWEPIMEYLGIRLKYRIPQTFVQIMKIWNDKLLQNYKTPLVFQPLIYSIISLVYEAFFFV